MNDAPDAGTEEGRFEVEQEAKPEFCRFEICQDLRNVDRGNVLDDLELDDEPAIHQAIHTSPAYQIPLVVHADGHLPGGNRSRVGLRPQISRRNTRWARPVERSSNKDTTLLEFS
jgi:hypothetical protein